MKGQASDARQVSGKRVILAGFLKKGNRRKESNYGEL
jgi:hypothetical protein